MPEEKGLKSLQVWQKSITLALEIQHEILPLLPSEEKWAMAAQLRRAVQSIPGNIAESYGRFYYHESVRYCYIARGSHEETYTYLSLANKLGYLSKNTFRTLNNEIMEFRRMLNGYITFLKKSKRSESEPANIRMIKEDLIENIYDPTPDYAPD